MVALEMCYEHLDTHAGPRAGCHPEAILNCLRLQLAWLAPAIGKRAFGFFNAGFPAGFQVVLVSVHLLAFEL